MNPHAFEFPVTRLGEIMHPDPNPPQEARGVLNPGGARALWNRASRMRTRKAAAA